MPIKPVAVVSRFLNGLILDGLILDGLILDRLTKISCESRDSLLDLGSFGV
jgi:hypothetical protein